MEVHLIWNTMVKSWNSILFDTLCVNVMEKHTRYCGVVDIAVMHMEAIISDNVNDLMLDKPLQ